jgi:hypothetical protein
MLLWSRKCCTMPDEQPSRRKTTTARPDFRRMIVETANPPSAPAELVGSDTHHGEQEQETPPPALAQRTEHEQPVVERQRHRTTVFLSPEIEDLVDQMKIAAKREGRRETLQDYIEQGIRLLAQSRGITPED